MSEYSAGTSEQQRRAKMTAEEIELTKDRLYWNGRAKKSGFAAAMLELAILEKRKPEKLLRILNRAKTGPKNWKCKVTAKRRNRIVRFVKKNPGQLQYRISEALELCAGTVRNDMVVLLGEGKVTAKKVGTRSHYFPAAS